MIIIPMPTPIYLPSPSSSGCGGYFSDYKSDISMCVLTVILDIVIAGLFLFVGYFTYYMVKEQEYVAAFLLGLVDLLIFALLVLVFEGTSDCFKWAKESTKEHKENKAIKENIARNKRLNSLESYGEFERLPERQKRLYISKENSIDDYVNSLFKKEKQNERK